jgi:hypothetical protein
MQKIQIILLIFILGLVLYSKYKYPNTEYCIHFEDIENCVLVPPDSIALNYKSVNFNKLTLTEDSLKTMYSFYKHIDNSLKYNDSSNAFVVDLTNSSYFQFISLLNICVKHRVKQIILNEKMTVAYIFPDCKIKCDKNMFLACFYTLNSNSIDFKLPARE